MIGALEVESPVEHSPLFEMDFCGLIDVALPPLRRRGTWRSSTYHLVPVRQAPQVIPIVTRASLQ
jgi:hypothetical protein